MATVLEATDVHVVGLLDTPRGLYTCVVRRPDSRSAWDLNSVQVDTSRSVFQSLRVLGVDPQRDVDEINVLTAIEDPQTFLMALLRLLSEKQNQKQDAATLADGAYGPGFADKGSDIRAAATFGDVFADVISLLYSGRKMRPRYRCRVKGHCCAELSPRAPTVPDPVWPQNR